MPESISDLTNERIAERISEILTEYTALGLTSESSDEDIAKAEELAQEMGTLRAEVATRREAAAARETRLANLADTFTADEPEPEPVQVEAAAEPESEPAPEPAPVAAAAPPKQTPVRRAAAHAPEVKVPTAPTVVITAAADVPGLPNGQQLDGIEAATEAVISRLRGLPTHRLPETRMRYGAAVIRKQGYGDLVQGTMDDQALVTMAGSEKRLKGGSLVAAGGWCAPSETLYDLCQNETLDGILSIPEFQVNRGGIRYSPGPDYSDIYNSASGFWNLTEAQAIAGTPAKTCYTITCPTPTDVRMNVVGVCIKVPILTNVGWPELTSRITAGALVAQQHKVNASVLASMEAAAGAAITVPDQGTLLFNLDHLEWQAEAIRQAYALADGTSVEVVLPVSARALIRAEFGRRTGVDLTAVGDAQISAWFSARNLAVQFVRDWQPLGAGHALQAVPTTIKALMYPSGSWTKGVSTVINLDVVYDSADLVNNIFTGLFVEEGLLTVQRCLGTTLLTIPVCVSGKTAAAVVDECMGTAATP